MPPSYDSVAAQAFADVEARSERLLRLLGEPTELVSLVLRGHLVLEELLFAACVAHCPQPEHLKAARLRFPQLVSLLRALEKIPATPPHYWETLLQFNSLRNALAHRLEPSDIEQRIQQLRRPLELACPAGSAAQEPSTEEQLRQTIHFLVGGFEVVAAWQEAVELLIAHRLQTGEAESAA